MIPIKNIKSLKQINRIYNNNNSAQIFFQSIQSNNKYNNDQNKLIYNNRNVNSFNNNNNNITYNKTFLNNNNNNNNKFKNGNILYYSSHVKEEVGELKKTTILDIKKKHKDKIAISMVTAYDVSSAKEVDRAQIDMILVGDSLGMVMLGEKGTTNVTMDQMLHHCKAVMKGSKRSFVVGDMPFGSFETSTSDGVKNAIRLMKEGGVDAIKLEGGKKQKETIRAIVNAGIPVVGHIGLTPQTSSNLGGFKLQGKTSNEALSVLEDALALQEAGCFAIVLEMVPEVVASSITSLLNIPTIGIGAGNGTSGQVLVYHDMLGLYSDFIPKFCKQYVNLSETINSSLKSFKSEIESKAFPSPTHSFSMKESELKLYFEKIKQLDSNKSINAELYDQFTQSNKNIMQQNSLLKEKKKDSTPPNTTHIINSDATTPPTTTSSSSLPPTTTTTKIITPNQLVVAEKLSFGNGKKPKIAVIGAGAMGSFFGAKLAKKNIADVWMVSSWKEHVDNINNDGLKFFNLEGKEENVKGIRATLDGMQVLKDGPPDLALVLVKSNSTKQAANTAATIIGGNPNGIVITLQNGIGNREEIESAFLERGLKNHVWQGITSNAAIVVSPGLVKQTGVGGTFLSSPLLNTQHQQQLSKNSLPKPTTLEEKIALDTFNSILNESGITSDITYDAEGMVWGKVVANAAINPLTAVLGVPNGLLLENEYSKNLMKKIIQEAMSVCNAKGIKLPYGEDSEEAFKYVADIAGRTAKNYSSMLQDVLRGQPTEINAINGVIVKEGEKFDINVSHNKMIMEMVLSFSKYNRKQLKYI